MEKQNQEAVSEYSKEYTWKEKWDSQEKVAVQIAECLDVIFGAVKDLKTKQGFHFVDVDYSVSRQEGSYIFFAKITLNKGLTKVERTFLFDIWHKVAGYEDNLGYLRNEVKRFLNSAQYL
jgi:hypothetical protein